ncbi:MAG: methionine--tRNA ligase, partial [Sphaerochaeta sp.]|nr:methionine--tRNA ligase [Sphaerochaeta sp.]
GDKLYIIQVDTGSEEPTTIVSSIVPYYEKDALLNRNIVLVQNLKPANFRGVKSRGMLLAASDPKAEPYTTCEVIFADQFAVGTELNPEGTDVPQEPRSQVKADQFFALPLYTECGVVKIDGRPIGAQGAMLSVTRYLDGEVG